MNKINDGGPAYPWSRARHPQEAMNSITSGSGMTLRDYFAAQIAPAYLAYIGSNCSGVLVSRSHKEIAEESYSIADALIAAREATP